MFINIEYETFSIITHHVHINLLTSLRVLCFCINFISNWDFSDKEVSKDSNVFVLFWLIRIWVNNLRSLGIETLLFDEFSPIIWIFFYFLSSTFLSEWLPSPEGIEVLLKPVPAKTLWSITSLNSSYSSLFSLSVISRILR